MKIDHTTTSMGTPLVDRTPRLPGTLPTVILPGGAIKRIYMDRDAAADGGPPWIIEEMTGLCRKHKAWELALAGFMVSGFDLKAKPAGWFETEGEVRFAP